MTPNERAERIYASWCEVDGFSKERFVSEIAAEIEAFEKEAEERGRKSANRTMQGLQTVLQRTTDLTDGYDDGFRAGQEAMREKACAVAEAENERHKTTQSKDWEAKSMTSLIIEDKIRAIPIDGGNEKL